VSIVIPAGRSRTGVPLPDAPTSLAAARLLRTRPLAVLAVVSYAAVTVLTAAAAVAAGTDGRDAGIEQLSRASLVAIVVATALTAAWTRRIAVNAARRGIPNTRPTAMTIAWFVPLAGPPAAVRGIGRLLRELDYSERRLAFWLFGIYAHLAATAAGTAIVVVAAHAPVAAPRVDALRHQANVLWLQAALDVVVVLLAARAVFHADRALSTVGGSPDA
jgi:hypothetical protein